jgi:hypothetical protein
MSSIAGGQFNSMPFNAGGNWVNQPPMAKEVAEMPRKAVAEDETGDTFTPTKVKPAEKSAFPVASTAIGGGVAGGAGFGLSAWLLPKNQPTELKAKEGKGVTIEDDVVKHNDYQYKIMEQVDGKFRPEKNPVVYIKDVPYQINKKLGVSNDVRELFIVGAYKAPTVGLAPTMYNTQGHCLNLLTKELILGLDLTPGNKLLVSVKQDQLVLLNGAEKNNVPIIFDIVKDADGKHSLKISKNLQELIESKKYAHITSDTMKALQTNEFIEQFKIFDAVEKIPTLKAPEAIENLIHGAGRKWGVIAAITAGTVAVGAGIGYLLGNTQLQQPYPTKAQL